MKNQTVDRATLLLIAGTASCDPSTAQRYFDGLVVRPMIRDRIEAALDRLGVAARPRKGRSKAA